jgi:toluene monooxygenase electron transfer component
MRAATRIGLGFPYECNVGECGNCRFELIEGWGHDLPAALLPRLAATVQFHSG